VSNRAAWAALRYLIIVGIVELNPIIHATIISPAKAAHIGAAFDVRVFHLDIEEKLLIGFYSRSGMRCFVSEIDHKIVFAPIWTIDSSVAHLFIWPYGPMKFIPEEGGVGLKIAAPQSNPTPLDYAGHSSVIGNIEYSERDFVLAGFTTQMGMQVNEKPRSFGDVGGTLEQSELFVASVPQLVRGSPQLVGGLPQTPSEQGHESGKKGSQYPVVNVNEFSRMSYREKSDFVAGALLLLGIIALLITIVTGGNEKNESDKKHRPDN
jgi:hypothetical protein